MRKISIHTVEGDIGLARSVANGTTKFPFLGHCADQMERMLEEIKEARKATPAKGLSDDEIADIYKEVFKWDVKASDKNWVGLARALIKKASEK
jgi:hypothetical protein